MSETIQLLKSVYDKQQFKNVVNTEFTVVVDPVQVVESNTPTLTQFFDYYNQLFYEIPKRGSNSHTTLIETSTQYVGYSPNSAEIDALVQEINGLRQQVLQQQQLIFNLTSVTGSNG